MKALVVGLGRMGKFHEKVLTDLGYEVYSVDPDPAAGADYPSVQAALHRRYRVAAIATPPGQLVESAFQLAGTPMIVEKPFAPTPHEAAMLGAYLDKAGAAVGVGYVERFNPVVRKLAAELRYPHVLEMRFTRLGDRYSEDPVTDLLTHDVDLSLFLLDKGAQDGRLVKCSFEFAGGQDQRVRKIELKLTMPNPASMTEGPPPGETVWTVDLMAHHSSPLHAMWHAFLSGGKDVARPDDAVQALLGAEKVREQRELAEIEEALS